MDWSKFIAFRHRWPVAFRVLLSLLVGIVLQGVALLAPFPALNSTRQAVDDIADTIMRKAATAQPESVTAPRFALIDIDDQTWLDWDAPLVTPRDKLAALIDHVASSDPAVIVVDVDLAFPGGKGEGALQNVLAAYHQAPPRKMPPVVLVRSLKPTDKTIAYTSRDATGINVDGAPDIHWALPSFERDEDGTVRRWQLATLACVNDAPVIIPSVQLQTAWLFLGKSQDDLTLALQPLRSTNCNTEAPKTQIRIDATDRRGLAASATPAGIIEINTSDPSSRIMYTIGWAPGQVAFGPKVGDSYKIVTRTAKAVLSLDEHDPVPGIDGRIAVIGGSFKESGDWYRTPLGEMPGALILINSIDALIQHGTLREPSGLIQFALGMLFVVLVAACVGWFRAPVSSVFSLVAIGGITFATVPLFRSGIMFSAAVPALVIVLVDLLLTLLEYVEAIRKTGWRWIFKPVPPPDAHEEPKP